MGMVTTPEGIQMWVPDQISALQALTPPDAAPLAAPQFEAPPPEADAHVPESVTGGKLPTQDSQQLPTPAEPPTTGAAPAPIKVNTPSIAEMDKAQKAEQKQAAQQAAYQASPEGQIASASQGQQEAEQTKAGLARVQGSVEAQQAGDVAKIEQQGQEQAQKYYADLQASEAARAAGLQEHQKQIATAVDTEAKYKVDDNRKYANLSTGKKIAYWIMAGLSGLGDALMKKTGPNMVIGMMQQAIQDDVAAQVRERDELGKRIGYARSSLDTYDKITGSDIESKQLLLAENYKRVADQVRASAAKYGGDLAKIRGEQIATQFDEAAEQIKGAAGQSSWDRIYRQQQLKLQAQQTAIASGHLALAREQFKYQKENDAENRKLAAAQLDKQGQGAMADKAEKLGLLAPPESTKDANGNVVVKPADYLRNQDGSVFTAPDDKTAGDLRTSQYTANRLISMIDEIRAIRDRVGGESSLLNSEESQRLAVLQKNILLMKKTGTQGMSSDKDMENISGAAGAGDAASWRDQSGKLNEARRIIADNLNAELKYRGKYTGPPIEFADPFQKPAETLDDRLFKESLKQQPADLVPAQPSEVTPGSPVFRDPSSPTGYSKATPGSNGVSASQRKAIGGLVDTMTSKDKDVTQAMRDMARARLAEGAQTADTPELRAAYQSALDNAFSVDVQASPEQIGPATSTARETRPK